MRTTDFYEITGFIIYTRGSRYNWTKSSGLLNHL